LRSSVLTAAHSHDPGVLVLFKALYKAVFRTAMPAAATI
jgi:hypothetical protein